MCLFKFFTSKKKEENDNKSHFYIEHRKRLNWENELVDDYLIKSRKSCYEETLSSCWANTIELAKKYCHYLDNIKIVSKYRGYDIRGYLKGDGSKENPIVFMSRGIIPYLTIIGNKDEVPRNDYVPYDELLNLIDKRIESKNFREEIEI